MVNRYNAAGTVSIAADTAISHYFVKETHDPGERKILPKVKKNTQNTRNDRSYHRTQMQKEIIIQKLKQRGCRITRQRLMLLDVILEEECSCCKEIYYKAAKRDDKIGSATIYRMVNMLEEIGAISRKNMYRIACGELQDKEHVCMIELDDNTVIELSPKKWNQIIKTGLDSCGYAQGQNIRHMIFTDGKSSEHRKFLCHSL